MKRSLGRKNYFKNNAHEAERKFTLSNNWPRKWNRDLSGKSNKPNTDGMLVGNHQIKVFVRECGKSENSL